MEKKTKLSTRGSPRHYLQECGRQALDCMDKAIFNDNNCHEEV